jgi:uncharacterized protein YnzC (UPF0291/DUF896 family)
MYFIASLPQTIVIPESNKKLNEFLKELKEENLYRKGQWERRDYVDYSKDQIRAFSNEINIIDKYLM